MFALGLALTSSAFATTQLTAETFDAAIAGKSAFVKFYAPWCGHCKAIAPTWDELATSYEGDANVVIADVDCDDDANEPLCSRMGVEGFPTIKSFTSSTPDGEDYEGGRELDDLKEFAAENLGPTCSLDSQELCSEEVLANLKSWAAKPIEELEKIVDDATEAAAAAETAFEEAVEKLQARYEELSAEKEAAVKAAKPADLGIAKSVLGYLQRKADAEEDAAEGSSGAKDEL